MLNITTKCGISFSYNEYDFLKIYKENVFKEIPAINLENKDNILIYYKDIIYRNDNELTIDDINLFVYFLSNLSYIKELDLFKLNIPEKKLYIYKNFIKIINTEKINNSFFITFKNTKNIFLNEYLKNLKMKNNVLQKNFLFNKNNLLNLMNLILLKDSVYKKNKIELFFNINFLKDLQLILLLFYKIKSNIKNQSLIIEDKHSLIKMLNYFNKNNNLKKLKTFINDIEKDFLYVGENQSYCLLEIENIKKF